MPLGPRDLHTISKYLKNLSESDLQSLGLGLGLYLSTIRGYGRQSLSQLCTSLLNDWIGERDDVKECGGATWESLVSALREEGQIGIADTIEDKHVKGDQSSSKPKSGGRRSSGKPTMPELLSFKGKSGKKFDIAQRIGTQYSRVGMALLDDLDHAIVPAITQQCLGDPTRINIEILGRWVRGGGIDDRSWQKLITVLRESGLKTLADDVEGGL